MAASCAPPVSAAVPSAASARSNDVNPDGGGGVDCDKSLHGGAAAARGWADAVAGKVERAAARTDDNAQRLVATHTQYARDVRAVAAAPSFHGTVPRAQLLDAGAAAAPQHHPGPYISSAASQL